MITEKIHYYNESKYRTLLVSKKCLILPLNKVPKKIDVCTFLKAILD